jgi:hypothetical protein
MGEKTQLLFRNVSSLLIFAILISAFHFSPQRAFAATAQIKDAAPGAIVSYGGRDWILLDPITGYVLAKNYEGTRVYDPDITNFFDPQDTNNIAFWLNDAIAGFYSTLLSNAANGSWIVDHDWSESTVQDIKVGLLSNSEWNLYKTTIGNGADGDQWWLRSRWGGNPFQAGMVICTTDIFSYVTSCNLTALDASSGNNFVRPALYLNPELYLTSGNGVSVPYTLADQTNPATSTVSALSSTVVADGSSSSTITVTLNGVGPIQGHAVSLTQANGSSTITPASVTTNVYGQAVFTVTNTIAETVTYTATDTTDGVAVAQTAQVTFNPGAADATRSSLIAAPISLVADGTASSTLTVTVKDAVDNAISGHLINLSQGSGSSTITPASVTTNVYGQAAFTVTNTIAETVTYTATDTTAGLTVVQTAQVTFSASSSGSSHTVTTPVIDQNSITLNPEQVDTTKPYVTLEVTPRDGVAYISIPASILTSFEGKNAAFFLEIKTPYGSYQVPVHLASLIPGLKNLLAANNLKAEDISFKVTLTDKSGNKDIQGAFANGLPKGEVIGAIVDFSIAIINTKTGKTIGSADKFSKALTRVIPMPKSMASMPEQWGAFRFNETTNKFEFVPARKAQIDGIWYVMINSYTNSVYVVADHAVSFTDMQNHWGKSFAQLAVAKGLVDGVGGGKYDPNRAVTRAEFTAMLIRALGRGTSAGNTAPYDDVKADAWYFGVVTTAKELGLLDFVNGKSFKPDQTLTREEMASMLAAVNTLEKLPITKEAVSLDGYKDISIVDAAYLEDVRMMVMLKIMTGYGAGTFSPKGETTRAQAAAVLIKTLQTLGSIDKQ